MRIPRAARISVISIITVLTQPTPEQKTKLYVLETYVLHQGAQTAALHGWIQETWLPAHDGPAIVLDAVVAAQMPQVATLRGYGSVEEWMRTRLTPPVSADSAVTLLEPTSYSPELVAGASEKGRIFEMRLYRAPSWPQWQLLHERFAGPEIKIFHRLGINPVLYSSTLAGPHMPNLVYLTPFADLGERERIWAAFMADPEWHKIRAESIESGGQISQWMEITLWRAAGYSPVR